MRIEQQAELTRLYTELVESYLKLWYADQMPADRAGFAARLLDSYMPTSVRGLGVFSAEEWQRHRNECAEYIAVAVEAVAIARGKASRYRN
jgi:hypothetical protein